ncbi:30S ribosomal protein S2 [Termitidicoccus mucosus]|uniref:Small ribosomal subunit protein uS2 n=1 Tax=Termitidicoccus mucosus TaxID=1184151 RepID=A0A178IMD5_9BACT|nr:30S ribosomal protein S2 [Opitutaceae bacterium TSB47]
MNVTPKDLLDAGVHFGHQTKRWNPRSKPYVFDHRQGITIIDLGKTHELLAKACAFIEDTIGNGGNLLFVGTKRQAQDIVREAAAATAMPYCVDRWLGGTLTNFATVKKSIAKFKKYQQMETSGDLAKLPAKEAAVIKREMARMQRNFSGIADMAGLPSAMFVIDGNHEKIAVAEAARCNIPCIGLIDTNSDPTALSHPIPGNDDAVKSVRIIVETIVEAVQSGLAQRESRRTARGQADLRAATAAVAEASGATNEAGEIDLSKVELPADVDPEAVVEGEDAAKPAKKKPARKKIAAPKDDAVEADADAE